MLLLQYLRQIKQQSMEVFLYSFKDKSANKILMSIKDHK